MIMDSTFIWSPDELYHHGIKGQKWGIRRYQNPDGTLTEAGRKRYNLDTEKGVRKMAKDISRIPWSPNKTDRLYYGLASKAFDEYAVNKYRNSTKYATLFDKKRRETNIDAYKTEYKIDLKYDAKADELYYKKWRETNDKIREKYDAKIDKLLGDKKFKELRAENLKVLKRHGYKSIDQIREENEKAFGERKQLVNEILENTKKVKLSKLKRDKLNNYIEWATVPTKNFINWGY